MSNTLPNKAIKFASKLLQDGKLVVVPTETVYGVAANAYNNQAVADIFKLKHRPAFNPLIMHYYDLEAAAEDAVFTPNALKLAKLFWPGPLTLVLKRKPSSKVSLLACAGLDTIAVRVPSHPVMRELLKEVKIPLAAPSANLFTRLSPTSLEHIDKALGNVDLYMLDGGRSSIGIESTIVDCSHNACILLRSGFIGENELVKHVGAMATTNAIRSPGQSKKHYSPRKPLRLKATNARPGEGIITFGSVAFSNAIKSLNLSITEDLKEAAANIFDMLHQMDKAENVKSIAVVEIPNKGLGVAINDRLARGAYDGD